MELLNKEEEKAWSLFTSGLGYCPPQYLIDWMKCISRSYKNCEALYYIKKEKGVVKWIFPFFLVKSRIFGDRIISQPFIDFGGPLGEIGEDSIKDIIEDVRCRFAGNIRHIEIRLNNFIPEYNTIESSLIQNGFIKEMKRHQFILKLEEEQIMWEKFTRITRKGIKKAKKSGLILKEINDEGELGRFYELYLKSMKDFGTPQHSYGFFFNFLNYMKESFRGLNCYKDGKLIGSLIVFYSNSYMYAAYNFSEHDYLIHQPNDILYWEMITWAVKRGIKVFDFGQCEINAKEGSHAAGIYKFKSKWNGILYERPYFYYSFGDNEKKEPEEKSKFKKMIGVWRNLPAPLIKSIGPKIASQLAL